MSAGINYERNPVSASQKIVADRPKAVQLWFIIVMVYLSTLLFVLDHFVDLSIVAMWLSIWEGAAYCFIMPLFFLFIIPLCLFFAFWYMFVMSRQGYVSS